MIEAKQLGIWENDVRELDININNDIAAALGLAGLKEIDSIVKKGYYFKEYEKI